MKHITCEKCGSVIAVDNHFEKATTIDYSFSYPCSDCKHREEHQDDFPCSVCKENDSNK
jgi:hypothetical protein